MNNMLKFKQSLNFCNIIPRPCSENLQPLFKVTLHFTPTTPLLRFAFRVLRFAFRLYNSQPKISSPDRHPHRCNKQQTTQVCQDAGDVIAMFDIKSDLITGIQ